MVAAHHAHRDPHTSDARTHSSSPPPRCPTLSVQAQQCSCDAVWLLLHPLVLLVAAPPIPLLLPPPFSTSLLLHQVCGCVRWWRGRRDACFTQPHHRPLANNSRLVAEGGGGCVTFTGCACGCTTSSPSPCYAVLLVGASMAHAAHTQPHPHFCLCNMGTTQATEWQKQTGVFVCCACSFQLLLVL